MSKRSGIIYKTEKGDFGLALYHEQHAKLRKLEKLMLKLYEDPGCTIPKMDSVTGKQFISFLTNENLTFIGFVD